jgi:acyl dehydratase
MIRRCSRRDALQEPGKHVSREDIRRFAGGFDPQPYLDEAAAERSPLKGLAASGWHTAAMVIRRALDALGPHPLLGIGADDLRWLFPFRQ